MADGYYIDVIRHLPTAGNLQKRYIGWTDEAIQTPFIGDKQFEMGTKLYGSDLQRAQQTASHYFPHENYHEDLRWRECNFGDYEGKTYADLEEDRHYRNWIDNPYSVAPPNGERLQQVENRVLSVFSELPSGAVIITHGGPIRVLLSKFSATPTELWSWDVPHGGMHRLKWSNEQAFKEGKPCTSILAVPITASDNL